MRHFSPPAALGATALVGALLAGAAAAQTDPARERLRGAVEAAVERALPDGGAAAVERILGVRPGAGISTGFDLGRASRAVFGRTLPSAAPDCRSTTTPTGDPDLGLCVLSSGQRDDPTGAYRMLAFSKLIARGDIQVVQREAFVLHAGANPQPVRLSDQAAYDAALAFVGQLGVPAQEIPRAPPGAARPLPVRTLVVGTAADRGVDATRAELLKVVALRRAFEVPGGLHVDRPTGIVVTHVPAPGAALVALADDGVKFARIDGWSDAELDPRADPRQAKTHDELVAEITDDLYHEGVREVGQLGLLVTLRRAMPNPDDPDPPRCPVCGVLRPALQLSVSQVGGARVETSEARYAAPGLVRQYDLVHEADPERAAR